MRNFSQETLKVVTFYLVSDWYRTLLIKDVPKGIVLRLFYDFIKWPAQQHGSLFLQAKEINLNRFF